LEKNNIKTNINSLEESFDMISDFTKAKEYIKSAKRSKKLLAEDISRAIKRGI